MKFHYKPVRQPPTLWAWRVSATLACLGLVAGCSAASLAPDLQKPAPPLPVAWSLSTAEESSLTTWWRRYNDPRLDALIARALEHNADLRLAAARVAESRALLRGRSAEQYPNLTVNAAGARLDVGDALPQLGGTMESYSVAPILSFEVDLWGKLANATEVARQQLLADAANARAVRLAIIAETASHYFALLALNERIAMTQRTLATRTKAAKLNQKLFNAGEIDELAFKQAESERQALQAQLPDLKNQRQQRLHALLVLAGASPAEIIHPGKFVAAEGASLPPPPALPALTPEQVVAGRPDIAQAEHRLIAANAQIGVARAAYLPRLSLTGLLGFSSDTIGGIFDSSPASGLIGSLAGPVLDFGRARAQVEASQAQQKQAYIAYEQTIRVAFREIMDALAGYRYMGEQSRMQQARIKTLQRSEQLARRRFDEGISSYLDLLDAQRNLYQLQTAHVETRRAQLQSSVDLYKALGGGGHENP